MAVITKAEFEQLKAAYQSIGAMARIDLARFCHADTTTVVIGERDMSYIFEGRRQVWLRINDFLVMPGDELLKKYTVERPTQQE